MKNRKNLLAISLLLSVPCVGYGWSMPTLSSLSLKSVGTYASAAGQSLYARYASLSDFVTKNPRMTAISGAVAIGATAAIYYRQQLLDLILPKKVVASQLESQKVLDLDMIARLEAEIQVGIESLFGLAVSSVEYMTTMLWIIELEKSLAIAKGIDVDQKITEAGIAFKAELAALRDGQVAVLDLPIEDIIGSESFLANQEGLIANREEIARAQEIARVAENNSMNLEYQRSEQVRAIEIEIAEHARQELADAEEKVEAQKKVAAQYEISLLTNIDDLGQIQQPSEVIENSTITPAAMPVNSLPRPCMLNYSKFKITPMNPQLIAKATQMEEQARQELARQELARQELARQELARQELAEALEKKQLADKRKHEAAVLEPSIASFYYKLIIKKLSNYPGTFLS